MKSWIGKYFITLIFLNITATGVFADNSSLKNKGVEFYKNGYYEDALNVFIEIPDGKRDEEVLLLMANAYESTGQKRYAIDTLKRLVNLNPQSYKAYYNLGNIFLKDAAFSDAALVFEETTRLNEKFTPAYYNLGIAYFMQNNFKMAHKNFKKALKLSPDNQDYKYNVDVAYKKLKEKK